MSIEFDELPDWSFAVEEVSVSVYKATARDRRGHVITLEGQDAEALLLDCRQQAAAIQESSSLGKE